jgi:hypothetical protein
MARRRHENGLKYQQRIESEQLRDRRPEPPDAPVPPAVTQLFETVAPPPYAPGDPYPTHEPHAIPDPHAPHDPHDP